MYAILFSAFVLHLLLCICLGGSAWASLVPIYLQHRGLVGILLHLLFFICLYVMLSSANKRRVLCWMYSARSFMSMRNNIGASTVPWGTADVTGILLNVSPSRITVCVLSVRKSFYPVKSVALYTIVADIVHEMSMWHFVERLGEVHYYEVSLDVFIWCTNSTYLNYII
jgi:hypothetical protein